MNQNPTCQCEYGYGAVTRQNVYDPATQPNKTQITCELTNVRITAFPDIPPTGTSSGTSSGGCSVGPSRRMGTERGALLGAAAGLATLLVGRRRRALAR
jgi:hypothetical protein